MKRKNSPGGIKSDSGRWLLTYSDLMNNLLVLFIMLYAISVTDLSKFQALKLAFTETFGGNNKTAPTMAYQGETNPVGTEDMWGSIFPTSETAENESEPVPTEFSGEEDPNEKLFDELYLKIVKILEEKNLSTYISVEKVNEYIYFRFTDGVLFEPNLPILKKNSYSILSTVGKIITDAYDLISTIDISGHTARDSPVDSTTNFFGWELSAERSITVLRYLVQDCDLPQSKMSISGHSHNKPYKVGFTEDIMALNRRVEIRISREIILDN